MLKKDDFEGISYLVLSDGSHYIPLCLSFMARHSLKRRHSCTIDELLGKQVTIEKWYMELVGQKSTRFSAKGLELLLIVESFKIVSSDKQLDEDKSTNLYSDKQMTAAFKKFIKSDKGQDHLVKNNFAFPIVNPKTNRVQKV